MNSSARAIEASTYSGPSTSRRIGMPLLNRASSSAMSCSFWVGLFVAQSMARERQGAPRPGHARRKGERAILAVDRQVRVVVRVVRDDCGPALGQVIGLAAELGIAFRREIRAARYRLPMVKLGER